MTGVERAALVGRWRQTLGGWAATLVLSIHAGEPAGAVIGGLEARAPGVGEGEILLGELNCVACHAASPAVRDRLASKPGPALTEVGRRVRPEFLRAWLLGPTRLKPGTTAPDQLHGRPEPERERAAEALTHFLVSRTRGGLPEELPASRLAFEQGRVLFHQVGCVACHAPFESADELFPVAGEPPEAPVGPDELARLREVSVPLGPLAAKYTRASLERLLRDPLAARPAGRMPSLNLTAPEARAIATYLIERDAPPAAAGARFTPDARQARAGREWFGTLGCAACHDLGPGGGAVPPGPAAPALAELASAGERGCLAEDPPPGVPRYHLQRRQREVLREALGNLRELARPLAPAEWVRRVMVRLNCLACHARDGVGEPSPERLAYFVSVAAENLGDEGRLPPHMTGVGEKLRPEWLAQVLTNQAAVRPYLGVRMPQFGVANMRPLPDALAAADRVERAPLPPVVGDLEAGRRLVGTNGLSCITCHRFGPHPGLNSSVLDLTRMAARLQRSWFYRYLLDPTALRPGTRMPTFWPDGEATLKTVLEGDSARQIESLWRYLSDGERARPPDGLPAR